MPPSQRRLLFLLRKSAPDLRFRSEHPVGDYSIDIFCHAARLAIEVDGTSHEDNFGHDKRRDTALKSLGIDTVRIPAAEIQDCGEDIATCLVRMCRERIS